MGKLVVSTFLTADGVMQAPGGKDEDLDGGFPFGGWQMPLLEDAAMERITRGIQRMDALLLGRKTYDIFAGYWPHAAATDPIGRKLNAVPKYVASRTLKAVAWNNSHLLKADLAAEVSRIKAKHAETQVIGSGDLAQTLIREGLVDRYDLWIHPLVLGQGKRLFAEGTVPTAFRLVDSQVFPKGVVLLSYEPAGAPRYADAPEPGNQGHPRSARS